MDIFDQWSLCRMRHFWQWFCGYICVRFRGRQVGRFLNLCSRNGIHLWRITHDVEHSIRANLRLRDFYYLKPYLRKTKTRLKILHKSGFPFWCYRHPKLKWFCCIFLCCISIALFSLNYVWKIEIKGNMNVATQDILLCLKDNKVDVGLKKNEIDCSQIELLLREQFHQIGWTSVYIDNTNLCIEVKESLYDVRDTEELDDGRMYHLVANKDAQVLSIVTRSGTSVVKEGQIVKKNDPLVLGYSEIMDDSGSVKQIIKRKADAQVYGLVEYEFVIPITEMELLSYKIAGFTEEVFDRIGNHKLSVIMDKIEENGGTILNKEVQMMKNENNICFLAKIYVREQIGINIPAEEVREDELK